MGALPYDGGTTFRVWAPHADAVFVTGTFDDWAGDRTPLTHETMWQMKRVGAPAISPDGKWVVFSVTEPSYDEKEQTSDLWLVPADGSAAPRKITALKAGESDPSWSPDSRKLAFVSYQVIP